MAPENKDVGDEAELPADQEPEAPKGRLIGIAGEPGPLPEGVIEKPTALAAKAPTEDACINCTAGHFPAPDPKQNGVCRAKHPHVQIVLLPRQGPILPGQPPFEPLFLQGFPEVPRTNWCREHIRRKDSLQ